MKKVIIFISILLVSVMIGLSFTFMEDYITNKFHPLKYTEYVEKYSEEYGVPQEIIYAVIKSESSFVADAVSYRGAIGLMQIMPSTYEWLCTKTGDDPNTSFLYDPEINIKYGTYLLSYFYSKFGVWETVYAAYNAGDTRVKGWLENEEYSENGLLVNIPIEETRNYVKRVTDNAKTYSEILEKRDKKVNNTVPVVE